MITAPYNFVPLNEKVFFPSWAEDISHDVPFEDGESGVIDIEITAKSPIFIRDSKDETEFCNHNGQYYIPATSIKGMVRNVLEIMSFSKLRAEQFTDNTYAVRDLSSAKNFYMTQMQKDTFCGWLKKDKENYIIEECGVPLRIHHKQIDYAFNVNFSQEFDHEGFTKTSEYKYNLIGGNPRKIKVSEPYKSQTNPKYDTRQFCKYDTNGTEGTLVLTGQPTPRKDTGKMGDGKGFEFVF
jgi:CRISPR-associated protein (TIGR03986 family)